MFKLLLTGQSKAPTCWDKSAFRLFQRQVFSGLLTGDILYYAVRMTMAIAKKPLLDNQILTLESIGLIGFAYYASYAAGKIINGFLSDYLYIGRFITLSLFVGGILECSLASIHSSTAWIVVFACIGWCQSVGSAPCCVILFQWFPSSQLGTAYSVWGGIRQCGEGLSWTITTFLVSYYGMASGFVFSGIAAMASGLAVLLLLKDRPQTYGFPDPQTLFNEPQQKYETLSPKDTFNQQLRLLKSPMLWLLGFACAFMYITRYGMSSWALLFLQERGYSLAEAGITMTVYSTAGFFGALASGIISDKWFASNRHTPSLLFGLMNLFAFTLLIILPSNALVERFVFLLIGFSMGGLLIFLAGLYACDMLPKKSAGAVKGILGLFAYMATAFQELASSKLIYTTQTTTLHYHFDHVLYFWFIASALSLLMTYCVVFAAPANTEKPLSSL
ncbi:MAG: MFS transporter [Cellvibrionales bacterium]|nr:MFS transporter [Cellvibrionales bacterium]